METVKLPFFHDNVLESFNWNNPFQTGCFRDQVGKLQLKQGLVQLIRDELKWSFGMT